tara:strand:+ start:9891 stop:11516 length:1626 start_codon:yes stop_codon:yes gene_type:complete
MSQKWYGNLDDKIAGVPILDTPPPWECSNALPEEQLAQLGSMENQYGTTKFVDGFTDYVKDERLSTLLKDKKVCFVGPSPHLIGAKMGAHIDSHDVVIRVNQTQAVPPHRWEDYGKRTDILVSCLNAPTIAAISQNLEWVKTLKFILCPSLSMWDVDKGTTWIDKWNIPWHNVCDGHLFKIYKDAGTTGNTGLSGLSILLNYEIEFLYVTGFSFYNFGRFGNVYYDEYKKPNAMANVNGANTKVYRHDIHALEPHLKYFKRMIDVHYPQKLKLDCLLENYYFYTQPKLLTIKDEMDEKGYVVLKNAIEPQIALAYKKIIVDYFKDTQNKAIGQSAKPDAFNDKKLFFLHKLFSTYAIMEPLRTLTNNRLMYLHHSDIHYNFKAYGYHDDTQVRDMKTPPPQEYSFIEGESDVPYRCYSIAIYLQDHNDGGGLTVIEGSHKNSKGKGSNTISGRVRIREQQEINLESSLGDVIVFDARLFHHGNVSKCKNRATIFFRMGAINVHGINHAKGAVERQQRQNCRRSPYLMSRELTNTLIKNKLR